MLAVDGGVCGRVRLLFAVHVALRRHVVLNGWSQLADLILVLCLSFGLGGPLMKAMRFVPSLAQVDRKVKELEKTLDAEPLKSKGNALYGQGRHGCVRERDLCL